MKKSEDLRAASWSQKFVVAAAILLSLFALSLNSAFAQGYPNLAGTWKSVQKAECGGYIEQNGRELFFKACQYQTKGRFVDERTIVADDWNVRGTISSDNSRIEWTNNNVWSRGGGSSNLTGCGLGTVWDEYESGWSGKWTRRGTSSVFDARWEKGGWSPIENILTVSISGGNISIHRQDPNISNNTCTYKGKIASDGVTVSGKYTCNDRGNVIGPLDWFATIRCSDPIREFVGTWEGISGDGRFREVWTITENSGRWSVSGAFYDRQTGRQTGGFYTEKIRFQNGVLSFRMIFAPKPHSSWVDAVEFSSVTVRGNNLTSRHEYGTGTYTRRR
jgi:hypothetical protein